MSLQPSSEFEKEIETKLDVPLAVELNKIKEDIRSSLGKQGWRVTHERGDEKDLLYYDTIGLDFYQNGKTLRRVTPFEMGKFPGTIRYDFKQGKGDEREEHKEWSTRSLRGYELHSLLGLPSEIGKIHPQFLVHIAPWFLDIERGENSIELKLDSCRYHGKELFRELELELKCGNSQGLYSITETLSTQFGFPILHKQKYSRARDAILGVST